MDKHNPGVRQWLLRDCPNINQDSDRPKPLAHEYCHFGSKPLHISHRLNIFKGLVYCRRCGCKTTSHTGLKGLAGQCMAPSNFGIRTLKALSEGKLPPKVMSWPADALHPALVLSAKAEPLSTFEKKLLSDMPHLSSSEAKIIANCMLRVADYSVQHHHGQEHASSSHEAPRRFGPWAPTNLQETQIQPIGHSAPGPTYWDRVLAARAALLIEEEPISAQSVQDRRTRRRLLKPCNSSEAIEFDRNFQDNQVQPVGQLDSAPIVGQNLEVIATLPQMHVPAPNRPSRRIIRHNSKEAVDNYIAEE